VKESILINRSQVLSHTRAISMHRKYIDFYLLSFLHGQDKIDARGLGRSWGRDSVDRRTLDFTLILLAPCCCRVVLRVDVVVIPLGPIGITTTTTRGR
jgi:hypothetical protein